MKIWTLLENTRQAEAFTAEHGLSLYIETGRRRILLDTGQTGAFAANAAALGVDLAAVNTAVLSHGHYDHGGGLERFLALNRTASLYLSRHALEAHYHGPEKYIGLDPALQRHAGRFIYVADAAVSLGDSLKLVPAAGLEQRYPARAGGLQVMENGVLQPEDFRHEIYLLAEENGRRVLFSGCSHKGVRNLLDWAGSTVRGWTPQAAARKSWPGWPQPCSVRMRCFIPGTAPGRPPMNTSSSAWAPACTG